VLVTIIIAFFTFEVSALLNIFLWFS